MLRTMPQVGLQIREKMPWIPANQPIFLQLDNAGGHGTKQAIREYTRILLEQHNVMVIHQPSRSPDTNVLDLGLWMSLQSHVEKAHRERCITTDAIAQSTAEGWEHLPDRTITSVFAKLPDIWQGIVDTNGNNDGSGA